MLKSKLHYVLQHYVLTSLPHFPASKTASSAWTAPRLCPCLSSCLSSCWRLHPCPSPYTGQKTMYLCPRPHYNVPFQMYSVAQQCRSLNQSNKHVVFILCLARVGFCYACLWFVLIFLCFCFIFHISEDVPALVTCTVNKAFICTRIQPLRSAYLTLKHAKGKNLLCICSWPHSSACYLFFFLGGFFLLVSLSFNLVY